MSMQGWRMWGWRSILGMGWLGATLRVSGEEKESGPFPLCLYFYEVLLQKHKISSYI